MSKVLDKWVDALRSGEYRQTQGALRKQKGGVIGYCCLGVLEDVCGVKWEKYIEHSSTGIKYWKDDYGELDELPDERASKYHLDQPLTLDEVEYIKGRFGVDVGHTNRMGALILMNDSGKVDFNGVAQTIEDLEWNNA